jgi:inosine-uridine nucleoside N-ribohydrolase
VGVETPLTRLVKEKVEHFLKRFPDRPFRMLMYDQLAVAALIDPTLFKTEELYVDVDINHGINYGVSVGGKRLWPGAEGGLSVCMSSVSPARSRARTRPEASAVATIWLRST